MTSSGFEPATFLQPSMLPLDPNYTYVYTLYVEVPPQVSELGYAAWGHIVVWERFEAAQWYDGCVYCLSFVRQTNETSLYFLV
jgi:hypothetical protein